MRRSISRLILAALLVGASAGASLAAGAPSVLTVGLNESHRVALGGEAAQVIVGDPAVADVALVDAHSVIVMGRGYGSTQLIVTDHGGRTLLASRVSVVGVGSDEGRVTLYRGVDTTEYGCAADRCHALPSGSGPVGAMTTTPSPSGPGGGGESAAAAAATRTQP